MDFVCNLGVDWIGLSFVQRATDVYDVKKLLRGRAGIIAKIEKPAAVNVFDSIIDASDGIMVARGDLGVELPIGCPTHSKKTCNEITSNRKTCYSSYTDDGKYD